MAKGTTAVAARKRAANLVCIVYIYIYIYLSWDEVILEVVKTGGEKMKGELAEGCKTEDCFITLYSKFCF
jgi:hypothetical protein